MIHKKSFVPNKYQIKTMLEIIKKILEESNLNTTEFFLLLETSGRVEEMSAIILALKREGLLNQEYFTKVFNHPSPLELVKALLLLKKYQILDNEIDSIIARHLHPQEVATTLYIMHMFKIDDKEVKEEILLHPNIIELNRAINILIKEKIITPVNLINLIYHIAPEDYAEALLVLKSADILDEKYLSFLASHDHPILLSKALILLKKTCIFNSENIHFISYHRDIFKLFLSMDLLYNMQMLNEENFNYIISSLNPYNTAFNFHLLSVNKILTESNKYILSEQENINTITSILRILSNANLLTQKMFDTIFDPQYAVLVNGEAIQVLWNYLPTNLLVLHWERILQITRNANSLGNLRRFTHDTLRVVDDEKEINPAQSTHTASVHESVYESIHRLLERYEDDYLEKISGLLHELISYIKSMPDENLKIKAAKRCIEKIIQDEYYLKTKDYQISISQLLALIYYALLDDNLRQGSLEDGLEQLIEGLYEIQRGGNLNINKIDDELEDNPICIPGIFNKLIEKMHGIHPDCEIKFVSMELASLKLPLIVKEETISYLTLHASPSTSKEYVDFNFILSQICNEGLEIIWDKIKENVGERLYSEFSTLFKNKGDLAFEKFISNSIYVDVDTTKIHEQLLQSIGYQAFCASNHSEHLFFQLEKAKTNTEQTKKEKNESIMDIKNS